MNEGSSEISACAERSFLHCVGDAHELPLSGRGVDIIPHVVVENNHASGVALLVGQVGERHGQKTGVVQFADAMRTVAHGGARIQHERQLAIGFAAVSFEKRFFGAGEDVPIDVPQIVAGRVGAILGELLAESEIGGAMQAGDETIDHSFRDEIQMRDSGEKRGVDEASWSTRLHYCGAGWKPAADW